MNENAKIRLALDDESIFCISSSRMAPEATTRTRHHHHHHPLSEFSVGAVDVNKFRF